MGTGTQIGRVRGLGSAKSGTGHWWMQRITALSNFTLMIWFVVSLVRLPVLDHPTVIAWIQQPLTAVPLLLLIASVCYHFRLGLQVLLEDYTVETRVPSLVLLNFYTVAMAFTAAFCVLKIAFGAV